MNPLRKRLNSSDWMERCDLAEDICRDLVSDPTDSMAHELIPVLAKDTGWEVRKVIADNLGIMPEPLFHELALLLGMDSNAMVKESATRAMAQRTPSAGPPPVRLTALQSELDRFGRRFGEDAKAAAIKLVDRHAAMHLRAAAHDIKNLLSHFRLEPENYENKPLPRGLRVRLKSVVEGRTLLLHLVKAMKNYSEELAIGDEMVSLSQLVEEVSRTAWDLVKAERQEAPPVEIVCEAPEEIYVPGSKIHLVNVFTNLIKNAVEAHAISDTQWKSGSVHITLFKQENNACLKISDTGKGMSPEELQDLRNYIPGGSSKSNGFGYGVPICHRYITAHGGTMDIESVEHRGTTVTIILPL